MTQKKNFTVGKSVDIIFCGLIRLPDLFKKSINNLIGLKRCGLVDKIIYSTWDYEVNKYERLRDFLKKNDVLLIESKEPEENGVSNIWCQMMTLDFGLNKVDFGKFVLKTRCDVYINPSFLKMLFENKEKLLKINKKLPKKNIFKYKVWVPWYEITRPFYMGDECFFGFRDDLKRLVNYDKKYDKDYDIGPGISHIRRFIHPFLLEYPVLDSSLGKYNPESFQKKLLRKFSERVFDLKKIEILRKLNGIRRFKKLRAKFEDEEYLDCLAAYYSILYSHFYIDGKSFPEQVIFEKHPKSLVELDSKNIDNNFTRERTILTNGGQIYGYNNELFQNACEKKMKKTLLAKRLMKSIDKFNIKK